MREKGYSIKKTIWKLVLEGMLKYGIQLTIVELCTIAAIYNIKVIIDYLNSGDEPFAYYSLTIFISFNVLRLLAIVIRNYYDLHVYNFYRYVQTAIQSWVF